MFVEALVPQEDLRALLASALPLTIRLDDTGRSHSLALSELLEIALVPEKGIRLVCKGRLHWPLLGIDAPLTVNALRVLLIPEVKPSPSGETLTFGITLEHADISGVPSALDDAISQSVNDKLAQSELSWDFSKTLARLVPLPSLLEELDALRTRAAWGKVRISEQALVFALCVHTTFDRRGDAGGDDLAPAASGEATPPTGTDRGLAVATRASPVAVTLATAALFGLAAGAAFFGLRSVASRW
jgi:hypothetical protein